MSEFLQFLLDHWLLSTSWLVIATLLLAHFNSKMAASLSSHQAVLLVNKENGIVLDVRDRKDFEKGHIVESLNIPLAKLAERVSELEKFKQDPIIVVCQFGQQSGEAVKLLLERGYARANKMAGGISEWQAQNLPLVK
jgi:rhodanese-related sulfurtransferase